MRLPLVRRKTYEALLKEYQSHEDHYWKQFAHNGMWERKYLAEKAENEKLRKQIAQGKQ